MKTTTTAQQSSHHWALPVTLLALMLGATPAFAQNGSRTWTGAVNADFYNGGNWSAPGDFPNGNVTFSGNTNTTIDRTSNPYTYVYGLYFNNTLGTQNEFTINGANKFFIGGAVIKTAAVTSGTLTDVINVDIQKAGTAEIFDMGSNHHLTVNGTIFSGGNPLTKTGAGTLTLSGNNTYTGTTTINDGTLQADVADVATTSGALGNGGDITFTGGTLQYTANSAGTDYSSRIKNSTSAMTFDTNGEDVTLTSNFDATNTGGLIKLGGGKLIVEADQSTTRSFSGDKIVNGGTLQMFNDDVFNLGYFGRGNFEINNGATLEFASNGGNRHIVQNTKFTFGNTGGGTIDFTNSTMILQNYGGGNTFTTTGGAKNMIQGGNTTLQNSQKVIFNVALGSDAVDLEVATSLNNGDIEKTGAGTLALTHVSNNLGLQGGVPNTITISDGKLELAGAGRLQSGNYAGDISNQGVFSYNSTSNQTLSGVISGTGSLEKDNSGTLTLTGTSTYTGATVISGGILSITNKDALGTTAAGTVVEDGAVLSINIGGNVSTAEAITINGTGIGSQGALDIINSDVSGTITLGSDATISIATRLDHGSTIEGSGFTLTKTGTGSMVRSGAFNASHLVIDQGQYLMTGAAAVPSGTGTSVTVNSGAEFAFWKNFSVTSSPNLILNDGSRYAVNSNTADQTSSINGAIALTGNVSFNSWSHDHTVNSDISGTGNLTLRSVISNQDAAKYTFTGNNIYTGSTTIGTGSTGVGKITLAAGSTTALSDSSAFTVTANSTLKLNGNSNSIGSLAGAGTVENANAAAATLTTGGDDTSTVFSGVLRNGTGGGALSLTKIGTGTLDLLMKPGTYTGTTTINEGTLRFTNEADLRGVGSSQFLINNGATLEFQSSVGGANRTNLSRKTFTFDGGAGTLNLNGGNHLFQNGTHNFVTTASGSGSEISRTNGGFINNQGSGNTVFTVADGAQDRDLVLSARWHNGSITKNGTGTMAITGPHGGNYAIAINAGTLEVGDSASLNGGTFTSTIANQGTFNYNSSSNQTLGGVISGTGALIKDNAASTLTLTETNTYSGKTTVQAGTLKLDTNASIANSIEISVQSGAIFDVSAVNGGFKLENNQTMSGTGLVSGPMELLAGSILAPGNSPGTLTMNSSLMMFAGSTLEMELSGGNQTIGGGINDLITGVTDLTLDGIIDVSETTAFLGNVERLDRWVVIEYTGDLTDNGITLGSIPTMSPSMSLRIDLSVAGQVALVAVPEPSSALLIVLGGIGFVFRRRK